MNARADEGARPSTAAANRTRLHAVVRGRVQGVGFRASVLERATRLGVAGWVRNRHDGTVEVAAEGTRKQLDELLAFLEVGPSLSHVLSVDVDWQEAQQADLAGFALRPTG